jgi:phospholipase C
MSLARLRVLALAWIAAACGSSGDASDAGPTGDATVSDGSVSDAAASDADAALVDAGSDGPSCAFVADPKLAASRAACAFEAGAKVSASLDDPTAARAAITHVIIMTHENRSFDHMYGTLDAGTEGFPSTYTNPTDAGTTAAPTHLATACPADISHTSASITAEWDNGKMDGFWLTDGPEALGYYLPDDHKFYSWLVETFATSDRYFCSTMGDTGHNRRFLYGASATQTSVTVFSELEAAKVDWGNYYPGTLPIYNTYTFPTNDPHLHPWSDFLPALDTGAIPPVVYLDTPSDEHPPGSMHDGESVVYQVLSHAFKSPLWPHLAIVFNYDEGGGFFDHVNPPPACVPSSASADAIYNREGFRVPLVVISPYARKSYVSHVDHSHTSTLRLVELLFDLPAITARDANSDALLDMFDFACPDFTTPPTLPAAPPTGCTL